jgi:hypothetical protein
MAQQAFNWSLDLSTPPGYSYVSLQGGFANPTGEIISFGKEGWASFALDPPWGGGIDAWRANVTDSGAPFKAKPVPHSLKVRWISNIERTYYELDDARLPYADIERLMQSSNDQERLDDSKRTIKGSRLVLGVAPGGVIVVWWADESRQLEIARFKAQTARRAHLRDWLGDCQSRTPEGRAVRCPTASQEVFEQFLIDQVQPELIEKAKVGMLPLGLWDRYRSKHAWEPIVQFTGQTAGMNQRLQSLQIHMLNGEKEPIHLPIASEASAVSGKLALRAMPRRFLLRWNDGQLELQADIEIDEQTVMQAFDKAHEAMGLAAEKSALIACVVDYNPQLKQYRFGFGIMDQQGKVLAAFAPKRSNWRVVR